MGSLFSYESKPMQLLMFVGDLMILNFVYLVCCIPIFTIGAAQAGLYTALRVLQDEENDGSPTKAFFQGFTDGFKTVTLSWGFMTLALAVVAFVSLIAVWNGLPLWLGIVSVCLCAVFQVLVPAFHSQFGCTSMQLIRNTWFLAFAHPLRSLSVTALVWLPVVVFLFNDYRFMALTPIWLTLYYSTALLFANAFLKKPFHTLKEHYNQTHQDPDASSTASDENHSVEPPEDIAIVADDCEQQQETDDAAEVSL